MSWHIPFFTARSSRLFTTILGVSLFAFTGCATIDGKSTPSTTTSIVATDGATSAPGIVRQTDSEGRRLPFTTQFPNRWSSSNDGTTYEPCTSVANEVLIATGLDPHSAADVASADHQTARGCRWQFAGQSSAFLSQFVGQDETLADYKRTHQVSSRFLSDEKIQDRTVLVSTAGDRECSTFVQSEQAIVATTVLIVIDPPSPAELCDLALSFTRSTIGQIPK